MNPMIHSELDECLWKIACVHQADSQERKETTSRDSETETDRGGQMQDSREIVRACACVCACLPGCVLNSKKANSMSDDQGDRQ